MGSYSCADQTQSCLVKVSGKGVQDCKAEAEAHFKKNSGARFRARFCVCKDKIPTTSTNKIPTTPPPPSEVEAAETCASAKKNFSLRCHLKDGEKPTSCKNKEECTKNCCNEVVCERVVGKVCENGKKLAHTDTCFTKEDCENNCCASDTTSTNKIPTTAPPPSEVEAAETCASAKKNFSLRCHL